MKSVTLLLLCLSGTCSAATLRPFVSLGAPVVRLSDLFEGAGSDPSLGPAPAPGGRITVEATQLAAIARQFNVDWRPASMADRVVLERPGRSLAREDFANVLQAALVKAGAAPDSDLEIGAIAAPLFPSSTVIRTEVGQLDYDGGTGRFTALLNVATDGTPTVQVRLSGRAMDMVELPTLRRRLRPGEVVGSDNLEWARFRGGQTRGDFVRAPQDAAGLVVRRTIAPGQPIQVADLGRPIIIQKGMAVMLSLNSPGIELTAQGIGMEPAGLGERVRIQNLFSRVVVEAEVTGPGRARVIPGSMPLSASRQASSR